MSAAAAGLRRPAMAAVLAGAAVLSCIRHECPGGVGCLRLLAWRLQTVFLRRRMRERDGPSVAVCRLVGGVDVSFIKGSETDACAALVVLQLPSLAVVYEDIQRVTLTAPYVPGYLAFREVTFLLRLLDRLRASSPHLIPDAILVDGNGKLHPHGFGLACHLGVRSGIPTVGIGKSLHHVDGLSKARLRDILDAGACPTPGSHATLTGDSGVVWGAALRTTPGDDFKPIFVSVGHAICLQSAVALAWRCCVHRVPEPVRQADLRSREWLRRHGAAEAGE